MSTACHPTAKESVFSYLFKMPEYALQLYRTLHPEDVNVTEDDCKIIPLSVANQEPCIDLGFLVGSKLIFLTDSQSTLSPNVPLRMTIYLAQLYQEYIVDNKLELDSETMLEFPTAEMYTVFSGDGADIPSSLHLSDLYMNPGNRSRQDSIETSVRVLRSDGSGSIVDQYIHFCKVADEQRRLHGATIEAVDETIRICREQGILASFLESHKKDVSNIMLALLQA